MNEHESYGSVNPQASPAPIYIPQVAPPAKKSSMFSRILSSLFVSLFILSVIMNFYLAILLSSGLQARVYQEGDEKNRIALISLDNSIDMQTAAELRNMLIRAEEDDTVRAVILVVNSPGGQVSPSNMIHKYITDYKEETGNPVYVSIQQLGASGAYWIACATDKIYAQTNAIVGSIGVIYINFVAEEAFKEKLGLDPLILKSSRSPYKFRGPPFRHPTDKEKEKIRKELDTVHEAFVAIVRDGRGLEEDEAWAIAEGDVYNGPDALEEKLIDGVGFLEDVIDDLTATVGLTDPQVIRYNIPPTLRELLLAKSEAKNPLDLQFQLEKWATTPKIQALWPGW